MMHPDQTSKFVLCLWKVTRYIGNCNVCAKPAAWATYDHNGDKYLCHDHAALRCELAMHTINEVRDLG